MIHCRMTADRKINVEDRLELKSWHDDYPAYFMNIFQQICEKHNNIGFKVILPVSLGVHFVPQRSDKKIQINIATLRASRIRPFAALSGACGTKVQPRPGMPSLCRNTLLILFAKVSALQMNECDS